MTQTGGEAHLKQRPPQVKTEHAKTDMTELKQNENITSELGTP